MKNERNNGLAGCFAFKRRGVTKATNGNPNPRHLVAEQNERWYAQLSYTACNLGLACQSGHKHGDIQ